MAQQVTMQDVAEIAGVSAKTVSNVLRGTGGASQTTREKVLAAVRASGYRLNAGAAALRSGRHGAIALAVPTLQQPIHAHLAEALMRAAGDVQVVLELTRGEAEAERALLAGSWRSRCDALVLAPRGIDPASETGARPPAGADDGGRAPAVVLLSDAGPADVPRVVCSPTAQCLLVAAHLRETGRRRVAVVGAQDRADRWTGACVQALRQAGLEVPEEALVRVGDVDGLRGGVEAVSRLLYRGARVDAVVCHNDALASGAAATLLRRGARVPQDVAVIGRGDTEAARYASPALTSVSVAAEATAAAVMDLLAPVLDPAARSGAPEEEAAPLVEVSPVLTVRASSGPVTS
ncbi:MULTISPECIES: LacI family DNA-binding transcriptional regulator [unclassified Actinomyces]|uniref:LacI family DNA-binding transcriptional regulator n=1 Tax=unclassified Actinomyces TaxID=2609248 RepID=UPI0020178BCD|nr:LacI family DNA-binding transcriptional regulator [Actinomyces sp. 187325]MCL3777127.1 LacI family DNA-binding transcriptional regulator [Actinomyces sp. AC-20-1]MCL3788957.1 LacI family DNA-binding transcriptional regulator [Actinomyces sp. 187325]MCL3791313.1 LacI family DNA-binding transcriptional regulator [Actinomyces sp. 186855]MCL3794144.1 LacI family DNA-binding transcriptional regulator [Actinomyces sp. 217892]